MSESQRILIVTDEPAFLRARLKQQGLETEIAKDCAAALETLLRTRFDLVVVDSTRSRDGLEFIKRVRSTSQLAGILILIIAEWGTGEATLALTAGADAFEPGTGKSIDPSRLITSIERL